MKSAPSPLWPLLLGISLLFTAVGIVHAAPSQQQWKTLNHSLVEEHILPRYQALQNSTTQLSASTTALCQQPDQDGFDQVQKDFQQTMDAWQAVQHIQFGPIETLMRNFSMQFWPDRKNLIGKQLSLLLQQQDPQTLSIDYLYKASIGVKGLPALERLLFSSTLADFENHSYRCQLTQTIAAYIAENSHATLTEWRDDYRHSIATAGSEESYYESHQEAAVDMMKSLIEPLEAIRDQKILRPLNGGEQVRPRRLESWRSQRSLRNIQLNIASLNELYSGTSHSVDTLLREQGRAAQADNISTLFTTLERQLRAVQAPLVISLNQPDTVSQLLQLSDSLQQLDRELSAEMITLDIQLGFNSRDGD
ncbi:imelysin family protein [Amphritea pacifica]|uniref:Imelysin family protein n=1 Tax=Amphritea pacifica TaxID=2811233 RepID=A0ABS2W2H2_9GAMM|nr:imelysin family protein [Amphritea pacifica]MBN0985900.1 imelysin family protein [Amphritea pacifica]